MRNPSVLTPDESPDDRFDRSDTVAIRRMSKADGCPDCVVNYETPRTVEPTRDGYRAHYECALCGHTWTTDYWRDD